jgi:hypothetical protein
VTDALRKHQPAQEIAQIVGEGEELEPNGVVAGAQPSAPRPGPWGMMGPRRCSRGTRVEWTRSNASSPRGRRMPCQLGNQRT